MFKISYGHAISRRILNPGGNLSLCAGYQNTYRGKKNLHVSLKMSIHYGIINVRINSGP